VIGADQEIASIVDEAVDLAIRLGLLPNATSMMVVLSREDMSRNRLFRSHPSSRSWKKILFRHKAAVSSNRRYLEDLRTRHEPSYSPL
jgi:hypothetical protein